MIGNRNGPGGSLDDLRALEIDERTKMHIRKMEMITTSSVVISIKIGEVFLLTEQMNEVSVV